MIFIVSVLGFFEVMSLKKSFRESANILTESFGNSLKILLPPK